MREQSNTNTLRRNSPHAFFVGADNFQRQTKPQTTIAHVDLAVAAPLSGDRCVTDKRHQGRHCAR